MVAICVCIAFGIVAIFCVVLFRFGPNPTPSDEAYMLAKQEFVETKIKEEVEPVLEFGELSGIDVTYSCIDILDQQKGLSIYCSYKPFTLSKQDLLSALQKLPLCVSEAALRALEFGDVGVHRLYELNKKCEEEREFIRARLNREDIAESIKRQMLSGN